MTSELKNIKILYLVKTMDVGGAERFTFNLARYFAGRTDGVTVASTGGIFVDELGKYGVKHIALKNHPSIINIIPLYLELSRITRENNYTIIHCQHRIFTFILQFMRKRKFILFYTANNVFNDLLQRTIIPDFAAAASHSIKLNLSHTTFLSESRIKQINYGVDIPDKKKLINKIITIGFLGRLIKEKGIFKLLEAVKILSGEDIIFRVIIRGKGETEEIITYINSNKLENIVNLARVSYDEEEIYKGIDVLVLPTKLNEGLPISILEAAARGILVVSTKAGGIEDFIEHGKTGIILESTTPEKLAVAIKEIIERYDSYSGIIENARLKVKQDFSIGQMTTEYEKLYKMILQSI
jgi:glycosyltransferase involved in cell wall biosynthesis